MSTLKYSVDTNLVELEENGRGHDIEFLIKIKNPDIQKVLYQMRQKVENDPIYTDILFYTFKDHLEVLVKSEAYMTFILELFKVGLIIKVQWED
jgi:hypothetical protein